MTFNPDEFLAKEKASSPKGGGGGGFDPDAFLAKEKGTTAEKNRAGYALRKGKDIGTAVVSGTKQMITEAGRNLKEEVAPGNRLETTGRAIARGVLSLADIVPLAINMTNRAAGALTRKGMPTAEERAKGAKGPIMPQPLIGGDLPYISDVVLGESQGPIETVAGLLGPAGLEKSGVKGATRLAKYYEGSKAAKADDVAQRIGAIEKIVTKEQSKEAIIKARVDDTLAKNQSGLEYKAKRSNEAIIKAKAEEAQAKKQLGRLEYKANVEDKLDHTRKLIKKVEAKADAEIKQKVQTFEAESTANLTRLKAKQVVSDKHVRDTIEKNINQVGAHLSGQYEKLFGKTGLGDEIMPGSGAAVAEVLAGAGEDVATNSKSGVIATLKKIIKEAEIEDGLGADAAEGVASKQLSKIKDLEGAEFTFAEAHNVKQILQEYQLKLQRRASTRGSGNEIASGVDKLVDRITKAIEVKLPQGEAVNYRKLGKDYAEYIKLKDNGYLLYDADKFRGTKIVDDIIDARKKIQEYSKYESPKQVEAAIASGSKAYTQYVNAISISKKHGFVDEAKALEDKLLASFKNSADIDEVEAFMKKNKVHYSEEDTQIINQLKSQIDAISDDYKIQTRQKVKYDARVKGREKVRNRALTELTEKGKDRIAALTANLDDVQKSRVYHILGTTSYVAALLPPGFKEAAKAVGFFAAMSEIAPAAAAKHISRVALRTKTLPVLSQAGTKTQAFKLLQGFFQYLENPQTQE